MTHLHVLHTVQPLQQPVTHNGLQSRVSGVQQHVGPPHAAVVSPRLQPRQLGQRGPRLRQQSGTVHPVSGDVLPLPGPPCALLALVQGVQGVWVTDVRVRVLALVVSEWLVRRREVRRLEVRRGRVRQRRRAGVGPRVRHGTELGQARAVARDTVMAVLRGRRENQKGELIRNYNSVKRTGAYMIIVYLLESVAPGHATAASNTKLIRAPRGEKNIMVSPKMTDNENLQDSKELWNK